MLIEFSVQNFKSFKDKVTLNMAADANVSELREANVIENPRHKLLKSAVLYGANGSGKSNLVAAFKFVWNFIRNSSKESTFGGEIGAPSFSLSTEDVDEPTFFELVFLHDGKTYRYGFEVDDYSVRGEWLFVTEKTKEYELFLRECEGEDCIEVFPRFKGAEGLEDRTRGDSLFLSVTAQFNVGLSLELMSKIMSMSIISGLRDRTYQGFTVNMLADSKQKKQVLAFLNQADLGIEDIHKSEDGPVLIGMPYLTRDNHNTRINSLTTLRKKFDKGNKEAGLASFDFDDDESEGTKKYFSLAGPLIDTLTKGSLLWVDELDARLHPKLTANIIRMFNSKETNPHGAQLIFATQDSNLLSSGLFRRDQIVFIEKDRYGCSDLTYLSEYKVRKDAGPSFEKNYLNGRFGAVPTLGELAFLHGVDRFE